jgi:rod shape-determining protein MreC
VKQSQRTRWIFVCAIITTVTLILLDTRGADGPLRTASHSILSPFQAAARAVGRPVQNIFSSISDLASLRDKNQSLRSDNDRLQGELKRTQDGRRRLEQLESMLDLAGHGGYRVISARVIAWATGQDSAAAITIDVGSADGIRAGMTVLTGRGLVGSTVTVGTHTTSVRLITDPQAHVGVRAASTGLIGMTSGVASGADLSIQMLAVGGLRKKQFFVTRGSLQGKPFVPGVPVGVVSKVTGVAGELPRGHMRPFVNFGTLDVVGVVVAVPATDPRDSLIPTPRPIPTVTVTVTPSPTLSPTAGPSTSASTINGRGQ